MGFCIFSLLVEQVPLTHSFTVFLPLNVDTRRVDSGSRRGGRTSERDYVAFILERESLLHSHIRRLQVKRRLVVRWVDWAVGLDHDRRLLKLVKWWWRLEHPLQGAVELWDHDLIVVLWGGGRRESRDGRAERDHWGAGCSRKQANSHTQTNSNVSIQRHDRHVHGSDTGCRRPRERMWRSRAIISTITTPHTETHRRGRTSLEDAERLADEAHGGFVARFRGDFRDCRRCCVGGSLERTPARSSLAQDAKT